MEKLKLFFYVFKWLALAFASYLVLSETWSKGMTMILIGFVAVLLVWEGIKNFRTGSS
jgi:hypothetical protein